MASICYNLDEKQKRLVNIAMNVIIDYSDDAKTDEARERFLNK